MRWGIVHGIHADFALGDFKVNVTGHPTKGSDAQIAFKLTIAAKDSFTLSTPSISVLMIPDGKNASFNLSFQGRTDVSTVGAYCLCPVAA